MLTRQIIRSFSLCKSPNNINIATNSARYSISLINKRYLTTEWQSRHYSSTSSRSHGPSQQSNTAKKTDGKHEDKDRTVTLIGTNGKLIGRVKYEEALLMFRKEQASHPTKDQLELVNVDPAKGIFKISLIKQQPEKVPENDNNSTPVAAGPGRTHKRHTQQAENGNASAAKKEKEFKLSDTITEHDLKVKINQMHLSLSKGHPVRITVARKKRKFTLFGSNGSNAGGKPSDRTEEEMMLEKVVVDLKDVGKVVLPIREQSNGQSWLTLLAPLPQKPPSTK